MHTNTQLRTCPFFKKRKSLQIYFVEKMEGNWKMLIKAIISKWTMDKLKVKRERNLIPSELSILSSKDDSKYIKGVSSAGITNLRAKKFVEI